MNREHLVGGDQNRARLHLDPTDPGDNHLWIRLGRRSAGPLHPVRMGSRRGPSVHIGEVGWYL